MWRTSHRLFWTPRAAWVAVAGIFLAQAADPVRPVAVGTTNAPAATNAVPVEIPKSVFTNDPKVGHDPFFPQSVRRSGVKPVAAEPASTNRPVVAAPPKDPYRHYALRGISGSTGKRIALINNQTFAEGEAHSLRTSDGTNRVKCLQIKDRSVVVQLEGQTETRELNLSSAR